MREIRIKAICNVVTKKGDCNPDIKGLKIDLMGTNQNPYFCIFPDTKIGRKHADGNCNGYEEVSECEIIVKMPGPHKCNCNFCSRK